MIMSVRRSPMSVTRGEVLVSVLSEVGEQQRELRKPAATVRHRQ